MHAPPLLCSPFYHNFCEITKTNPVWFVSNIWHNRGDLSAISSQNNAFYLICLIGLHIYPIISPY